MRTFVEKPRVFQQITSPKSTMPRRVHSGQNYKVSSILHSQRMTGRQVAQRSIKENTEAVNDASTTIEIPRLGRDPRRMPMHLKAQAEMPQGGDSVADNSTHGLKPGVEDNEILRGRTTEEVFLDMVRPAGTALENALIANAGASSGVSVTTIHQKGPTWSGHGAFVWHVDFKTTGRNGWIVQDIVNTWRAKDAAGKSVASPLTPHYLEAWAVDSAGKVTPRQSIRTAKGPANDYWDTPNLKLYYRAAEGHSATMAKVYFTKTNPATQGFIRNNPATNAAGLLSSTTTPAGLGSVRLYRYTQSTWDSTKAVPTFFGSAGP